MPLSPIPSTSCAPYNGEIPTPPQSPQQPSSDTLAGRILREYAEAIRASEQREALYNATGKPFQAPARPCIVDSQCEHHGPTGDRLGTAYQLTAHPPSCALLPELPKSMGLDHVLAFEKYKGVNISQISKSFLLVANGSKAYTSDADAIQPQLDAGWRLLPLQYAPRHFRDALFADEFLWITKTDLKPV